MRKQPQQPVASTAHITDAGIEVVFRARKKNIGSVMLPLPELTGWHDARYRISWPTPLTQKQMDAYARQAAEFVGEFYAKIATGKQTLLSERILNETKDSIDIEQNYKLE